jgi:hypothetical protein
MLLNTLFGCALISLFIFLQVDLEINGEPVEIQMQLDDEGDINK